MTRRVKRRAGYTMIEVMMALGVLTAGSVAIMAMHQAATRGNLEARQITTANQIAQQWVERLRRDALNWTAASNGTAIDPTLLARTAYLNRVPAPGTVPSWFVPVAPTGGLASATGETPNFDFYGEDVAGDGTPHYCTNLRLEWLFPGQAMRADVRVWWLRRTNGPRAATGPDLTNCAPGINPDALTGNSDVRMVYTSTVIRYTP